VYQKLEKQGDGGWGCLDCGYVSKKKSNAMSHIESVHLPAQEFTCQICGKFCPNRNAMNCHMRRHKKSEDYFL